jgi:hypothetical protein
MIYSAKIREQELISNDIKAGSSGGWRRFLRKAYLF